MNDEDDDDDEDDDNNGERSKETIGVHDDRCSNRSASSYSLSLPPRSRLVVLSILPASTHSRSPPVNRRKHRTSTSQHGHISVLSLCSPIVTRPRAQATAQHLFQLDG